MQEPVDVARTLIRQALDECPAILPKDQRYADFIAQALAKDQVSERVARALAGAGVLKDHA